MFDPVAYINEPRWRHSSLGLERITLLLEKLGRPQDAFLSVHVAGTNGKGSTSAYLSSILRASNLRTGLFTSPFIERFEERIQVDGEVIPAEELLDATLAVRDAADEVEQEMGEHPTEFELMCAVAFVHFARRGCDVAVVECGLGGRLDATNVVSPAVCVVTRIGMDHTDVLGDTLSAIAAEKAGIIKEGVPVVSWPQQDEATSVIRERCNDMGCELVESDFSRLEVAPLGSLSDRRFETRETRGRFPCLGAQRQGNRPLVSALRRFCYRGRPYETKLLGAYQPTNAAVAIDAARVLSARRPEFGITQDAIARGVADAVWPGRFEVVAMSPLVVVDGAHNPQGAEALAESMRELVDVRPGRRPTLVVGVLADKDYPAIVAPMLPYARRIVAYTPDNPRALDAAALAREAASQAEKAGMDVEVAVAESAGEAMSLAVEKEGPEGMVVAFGTLYSIGAVKQALAPLG